LTLFPDALFEGCQQMEGGVAMNIVRWDPLRELEEMSERLNRMFARPTSSRQNGKESLTVADWIPQVDISEADHEYVITAELPGLKKEDVKITLEDGVLTLQGERKQEKEHKGTRYHRVERSYGSFLRSFTLPDVIEEAHVAAEFKEGVLSIRLPKSEKAKPKAIEVKVA
jgi:HSP20 family protein